MVFENLTTATQDLLTVNFEFFGKLFLLFFFFSVAYIFATKKDYEPTPYIFIGYLRFIGKWLSKLYLFIFPLFIFLLYPQVSLSVMLQYLTIGYGVAFFVLGVLALFNIMFYTPVMLLKVVGYDPMQEQTNEILKGIKNLVGHIPFVKQKKRW